MTIDESPNPGNAILDALTSLPEEITHAVRAACIPHRYTPALLADLLKRERSEAETLFRTLSQMPFCRLHDDNSAEVHEVAREAILGELVRTDKAEYQRLSGQAAGYFARAAGDNADPSAAMERIYHDLAAIEEKAAEELLDLSEKWWNEGEYQRVLALAQLGLQQARRVDLSAQTIAVIQYILGTSFALLYRYDEALTPLQSALKTPQESELHRLSIVNLADAYYSLERYEEALASYEQALAIARTIGDRCGEIKYLGNLGTTYHSLNRMGEAISFYGQALSVAREIGDRRSEGKQLGNLGATYYFSGQVEEAISFYGQALAIAREIGDQRYEGDQLGNLGIAYADLGQVQKAVEFHEQAVVIQREIGDQSSQGSQLSSLGLAYKNLDRTEDARLCWEEALRIFTAIKSPYAETVRQWLAELGSTVEEGHLL